MRRTTIAALVVSGATLIASGCGESTKSSSKSTTAGSAVGGTSAATENTAQSGKPLTRAQLISAANAICARVNSRRAATSIESISDYVTLLPALSAYEQSAAAEMAKLTPPSSLAHTWQKIVAGNELLAHNTASLGEYAKANNLKGAQGLYVANHQTEIQVTVAARKAGLHNCVRS